MEDRWYLVKLLTNAEGQDASSVESFVGDNSFENAQVSYHNILAAYHNAADVLYAVVSINNYIGNPVQKEIVDHRPPEPEPEPEEG